MSRRDRELPNDELNEKENAFEKIFESKRKFGKLSEHTARLAQSATLLRLHRERNILYKIEGW